EVAVRRRVLAGHLGGAAADGGALAGAGGGDAGLRRRARVRVLLAVAEADGLRGEAPSCGERAVAAAAAVGVARARALTALFEERDRHERGGERREAEPLCTLPHGPPSTTCVSRLTSGGCRLPRRLRPRTLAKGACASAHPLPRRMPPRRSPSVAASALAFLPAIVAGCHCSGTPTEAPDAAADAAPTGSSQAPPLD